MGGTISAYMYTFQQMGALWCFSRPTPTRAMLCSAVENAARARELHNLCGCLHPVWRILCARSMLSLACPAANTYIYAARDGSEDQFYIAR